MQQTFIQIHKERLKQYKLKQIANLEEAEWDRLAEYDPFAEDEEYDRSKMMKDGLGDAMNDAEKALPRQCRRKQPLHGDGRSRWQPPIPLTRIGRVEKQAGRKKHNPNHNPWPYTPGLFEALYWFWASIQRYDGERTKHEHDDITTTSYVELTVASSPRVSSKEARQAPSATSDGTTVRATISMHPAWSSRSISNASCRTAPWSLAKLRDKAASAAMKEP